MSLNWKEIDAVLSELPLENSHIQKVFQPDFKTLVFQIYSPRRKFFLLISLAPGSTRMHSVSAKPEKSVKLQRFAQFLRSRIEGGRITEVRQIGSERIVKMVLRRGGEEFFIWIRLWGNAANIIVTDSGFTVLDAFYRRPKKGEVSGGHYNPEKGLETSEERRKKAETYSVRRFNGEEEGEESSFNDRLEEYYGTQSDAEELERLRTKALQVNREEHARYIRMIRSIEKKLGEYSDFETFKEYGDLITNSMGTMKKGSRWLETENWFSGGIPVTIELDPAKSPAENAEMYYQKYRKAKSGLSVLEDDLQNARHRVNQLEGEKSDIEASNDTAFLRSCAEQARPKGQKGQEKEELSDIPGLQFRSGQYRILVGRNARENDQLLRKYVRGNDMWLHTRDYPGGYVFIKNQPGKSIPLDILLDAGNLALHYSKGKNASQADLYYTQVKHLRRAKNGKPGTVIPHQEKNLTVRLDRERLDKLFGNG